MVMKHTVKKSKKQPTEDMVAVISKDNIRTLRPHTDPEGFKSRHAPAVVLDQSDFVRIKMESVLLPEEQRRELERELIKEKEQVALVAASRRSRIEEYERKRVANAPMSDLDQEKVAQNDSLLEKATRQLEEEEDEIKRMNELILHAKCMAIREAQMAEKKWIKEAEKREQQRLDAIMEAERVREIERVHEREQARKLEMRQGAVIIRKQIEERREAGVLEAERKDREIKANLLALQAQNEKDIQLKVEKARQQHENFLQIQKANAESVQRRKNVKIVAREEDRRIMEYLMNKDKGGNERDAAEKKKRAEKERELKRQLMLQERLADKHSEQDALRAKRASEAHEREYRRKEKEAAERRVAQEKALLEERNRQQRDREHVIAVEALKMKQEFYEMLKRQQDTEAKLKHAAESKHIKNRQYAKEVQEQIAYKESLRQKERATFFKEAARVTSTQKEKKAHLETVKERKLREIVELGVPERYCNEIRRKMALLEKDKISNQPTMVKSSAEKGGE